MAVSRLLAKPQATLATVKAAAEAVKTQRVEKAWLSSPESGIITISAIK